MTRDRLCWRCKGTGTLGVYPGGAPLICKICRGLGTRKVIQTSLRERIRIWWKAFVRRHIVKDYPWKDVM
jgi:hypothetical protein